MNRSPDKIIALIFLLISLLVLCLAFWQIVF
ncbi:protein MgtR [Salmonella sp. 32101201-2018-00131-FB-01-SM-01]|nr:protein MgtR [Salmonella sp. 32101201-2018-00131-FB-01-SM-01]EMC3040046.1 protein MgtR [Salmonella enterica]MBO2106832.1 protein MgtR [Salmonella sp. 32101201-2018-00131-FB-01-SM-01]HBI0456904.1 protein MgtR [Salmonella enterica subsp. enterica serovar Dublin]